MHQHIIMILLLLYLFVLVRCFASPSFSRQPPRQPTATHHHHVPKMWPRIAPWAYLVSPAPLAWPPRIPGSANSLFFTLILPVPVQP
ncbi:hypothetical protein HOY82DRAFT_575017 [Tuber indicum]|nr:hypothetical protein HOY82DRAFT_575017 [Tuber indicum]